MTKHSAKPLCECLGVTMQAARAYLAAASDWIPSGVCPFYFRIVAHCVKLPQMDGQILSIPTLPDPHICETGLKFDLVERPFDTFEQSSKATEMLDKTADRLSDFGQSRDRDC